LPILQVKAKTTNGIHLGTLTAALLVAVGVCVVVAWWVCNGVADRIMADSSARGLAQMRSGADAVAGQARLVLRSLGEIERQALVITRVGRLDDGQIRAVLLANLRDSMRVSRLGVSEIAVFAPSGRLLLHEGVEHGTGPEGDRELGFGQPWTDSEGRLVLRRTSRLDGNEAMTLQMTLDPEALSDAVALVLPRGLLPSVTAVATLARMTDGRMIARSELAGRRLDEDLRITAWRLQDVQSQSSGTMMGNSHISDFAAMRSYQTLPELGLVAVASASTDGMLALARLQAEPWRNAPWALLVGGLLASLALIGWEMRRQGRAALDAERRLAAAEAVGRAELEELVRCSPALLYRGRLDPLSQYSRVYATPNSLAITGWTAEEMADPDKVWSHAAQEDQHIRGTNYARAHREGRAAVEYRYARPDGGYSWLRNEVVVIRHHPDGSADVVGAVTNITREHELASQAAQLNRMATLGEIATSIAHELSQPVTVITMAASYAQSLADEMGGAGELGRQIDAILAQAERAGDIIRHLRSYGHAEGGAVGAVDLRQAVAGAMVLAGQPLAEAMVQVVVEWPADLPMVRGRLVQVEQVLLNLFINARDAMREVPDTGRHLRIFTEVSDAGVEMHVADSGPGVPAEVMPRLFEPFFTTKALGEGTGLGLSLCRTMMEGFGGTISVRNGDLGSEFSLCFAVAEKISETG